jgi:uncharacterized protein YcbX
MSDTTGIPPQTWVQQAFILLVPGFIIPAIFMLLRETHSEPNPYIYEKLGIRGPSNLRDEEDDRHSSSQTKDWKVKALLCHPIKSCGGIELEKAQIDGAGIIWDRKFVITQWNEPKAKPGEPKKPNWVFRTMRAPGFEKLALVETEIWLRKGSDTDGLLILRYPYIPTGPLAPIYRLLMALRLMSAKTWFQVPLEPPENHKYPNEQIQLWDDSPTWLNLVDHVPRSLQALVESNACISLFRVDPLMYREVHGNAPKADQLGYQPVVGAADSYPLSIQNLASVRAVAHKIEGELPHLSVRRFRPNIIISGGEAFDEDDWQRIKIGEHEIYCSCNTTRCKLPCVDPDTAIRHPNQPEQVSKNLDMRALLAAEC